MKIFFILLFLSLIARAELQNEVSEDYCSPQYYDCSEASHKIVQDYFLGHTPEMAANENLYVGSCYMVSESYQKDHEHFAYLYFRKKDEQIDFFGQFAFFYDQNPFSNLSFEEARKLNADPSAYKVLADLKHWRVDTSADPPWQYFMRENGPTLLVIGFWGLNDSITCRLDKK